MLIKTFNYQLKLENASMLLFNIIGSRRAKREVEMKIAIGSDKSGYSLKEAIKTYLAENKIAYDDLGTTDLNDVRPFFKVAEEIAPKIQNKEYELAILVCGTGAGMAIVANKFKGVYAVACESVYTAKMARAVNGAQVLCMGGWIVAPEMGLQMAKAFITLPASKI